MYTKVKFWTYAFPPFWKDKFVTFFVSCLDQWEMMRLMIMETAKLTWHNSSDFLGWAAQNTIGWIIFINLWSKPWIYPPPKTVTVTTRTLTFFVGNPELNLHSPLLLVFFILPCFPEGSFRGKRASNSHDRLNMLVLNLLPCSGLTWNDNYIYIFMYIFMCI